MFTYVMAAWLYFAITRRKVDVFEYGGHCKGFMDELVALVMSEVTTIGVERGTHFFQLCSGQLFFVAHFYYCFRLGVECFYAPWSCVDSMRFYKCSKERDTMCVGLEVYLLRMKSKLQGFCKVASYDGY